MSCKKIVAKHINVDPSTYVGKFGELLYDEATLTFRGLDGVTPGGNVLSGSGSVGSQGPQGPAGPQGIPGISFNANADITFGGNVSIVASGTDQVFVGWRRTSTDTNSTNLAFGVLALRDLSTGQENIALGSRSLLFNTTASQNIAVGSNALLSATTGGSNTGIGAHALESLTTGVGNTGVGQNVGFNITTGQLNTVIGLQSNTLHSNDSKSIVIGALSTGLGSNTTVIGTADNTTTQLFGNLQIGNIEVISASGTISTTNISGLANVAVSGSYADLTNIPSSPTIKSGLGTVGITPDVHPVTTITLPAAYADSNYSVQLTWAGPVSSTRGSLAANVIDAQHFTISSTNGPDYGANVFWLTVK
jgi:hypothetical protein